MDRKGPLHITFDRNVAIEIWKASRSQTGWPKSVYDRLLTAIQGREIRPYISEATLTFELFNVEDRLVILARYFARPSLQPIPPEIPCFQREWMNGLLRLGFKVLRQPPRVGLKSLLPLPKCAWAQDLRFHLEERIKRQQEFLERFEHMTFPRLRNFGLQLAQIHGLLDKPLSEQPFSAYPGLLWYNGLEAENRSPKKFRTHQEFLGAVREIFSDWFDVDSVCSHYGYGLDYFCTGDKGRGKKDEKIFHPENREMLACEYGVRILAPEKLLEIIER